MEVVYRPRRERPAHLKRGRPGDIKIGILMPLPYRAAAASLFMHNAFWYLNSLDGVVAYRYVYNIDEDVVEALDSNLNPRSLDALLVSLAYELDYVAAARVLSGLGLLRRVKGPKKPVIVAGGVAPTSNPLPLSEIVDAVFVGEVDLKLRELAYALGSEAPLSEVERVGCTALAPFEGPGPVDKCYVDDLDKALHAPIQPQSPEEEPVYGLGLRVELSRGCPYLCAFCMEAHVSYPFRYMTRGLFEGLIRQGVEALGVKRVVLYSLSPFNVPYLESSLERAYKEGFEASLPSLRVEQLKPKRLELIRMLGQKVLTIAPETLLRDLACALGKCYGLDTLVNVVHEAHRLRFTHVKMYLVTGFPTATLEDELASLREFIEVVRGVGKSFVKFALTPLIPKPWTPYQYLPPAKVLDAVRNVEAIKKVVRGLGMAIEALSPWWGFAQAVIAQGHRATSRLIIEWALKGLGLGAFKEALKALSVEEAKYIHSGWEDPPWSHVVKVGIPQSYLQSRFRFLASRR